MSAGAGDEPAPLRDGIELFLRFLGAPPVDVVSQLRGRWDEIVGPALAGATRPVELVDGVLTVGCDDPAWAAQIGWMDAQIKGRFAEIFPDVDVQRVRTKT